MNDRWFAEVVHHLAANLDTISDANGAARRNVDVVDDLNGTRRGRYIERFVRAARPRPVEEPRP